jgi:hypothetical protein
MWLLGIELRTSGRADSALNHWAISPVQIFILYIKTYTYNLHAYTYLPSPPPSFAFSFVVLAQAKPCIKHQPWDLLFLMVIMIAGVCFSSFLCCPFFCVCVCVWEREREREREHHPHWRQGLTNVVLLALNLLALSSLWSLPLLPECWD